VVVKQFHPERVQKRGKLARLAERRCRVLVGTPVASLAIPALDRAGKVYNPKRLHSALGPPARGKAWRPPTWTTSGRLGFANASRTLVWRALKRGQLSKDEMIQAVVRLNDVHRGRLAKVGVSSRRYSLGESRSRGYGEEPLVLKKPPVVQTTACVRRNGTAPPGQ